MTSRKVASVCPYCGVGCGIVMEVENDRVIKVTGDRQHPTNFGRLCTKGNTCAQALTGSGRLEHAYLRGKRRQDPVRVEIDIAIHETANRLRAIIDEHGPDAFAFYVSGQMSLEAQYLCNKLIKGYIGSNQIESNSRLCMASAGSGYKLSLGADGPPGSYQDFDKADLFFVIGANMADCHPILFLRMMDRVKAGAKLIVVDPRRNATADKSTLFLQIRPGTDLALLNGLLHLLHENGHTDADFIAQYTEGWEAMPAFLADYTPEKVAAITGLDESDIRKAADMIGSAPKWMSCWTMGLNQSSHGTWNTNAICNLHLATGTICRPGSGPFSLTGQPNAMGGREMGYMGPGLPGQRSVLVDDERHFVEDIWGVPRGTLHTRVGGGTVALFEAMAEKKVKACWIICTNPVATVANRANVIAGLEACELVITQDAFLDTETNRYADILLPGALWAEAEGVMINSERNLTLMQQAVPPPGNALPDWQIIARVACAMGYADGFSYSSAAEVFDEIRRFWNPKSGYDIRGASFERLRTTPLQWPCPPDDDADRHPIRYLNDGVSQQLRTNDDGTQPRIVFATKSGRGIFFARPHIDPIEMPDPDFPLVLNTGRLQHQWHTMTKTGKIATLNKLNPGPFVEIHPEDATALGIRDKQRVEIRSRRGRALLPAVVTDRVRPGNCFAPFHWNDVFGDDLAINAVTSDAIDPISQQPEFKFSAVALARVDDQTTAPETPDESNALLVDATAGGVATARHAQAVAARSQQVNAMNALSSDPEIDTMQITALARLLGLDTAPAPALDTDEKLYLQGFLLGLDSEAGRCAGGVPTLPATAPIEPSRRLLIDGMLAGLFSRSGPNIATLPQPANSTAPAKSRVTVLWASQTGNVEAFAESCAAQLQRDGFDTALIGMDSFDVAELARCDNVLLLTSTFGDGDPPDNGAAFWSALQADGAPNLSGVRFGVLAFGDSNYDQFCGFGRRLDARLEQLGAQRLLPRVDCDADFETPARQWLTGLPARLQPAGDKPATPILTLISGDKPAATAGYGKNAPFASWLLMNRLLNGDGATKETRQFVLGLDHSFRYEAGDALGIWPRNCPGLVDELIGRLQLSADSTVNVDGGDLPLAEALLSRYEIARVTRDVIDTIAAQSRKGPLAELVKAGDEKALKQWLWGRQLIDVLHEHPDIHWNAGELIAVLKRLQPRLYSISSSPKIADDEVHLTVSTVRYQCGAKQRKGVSSTFLADRARDTSIPIFLQKSAHFRPPADPRTPMIMIGPGTGIAPFRAFLHERRAVGADGKHWLFFGEQHAATDFYYRDELEEWRRDGFLNRLDLAFSRDQSDKIYVQDRMREQGAELWRWLQEGAHLYVCGDASRMAKDVDRALRDIAVAHGGLSAEDGEALIKKLGADKRYVRDVY